MKGFAAILAVGLGTAIGCADNSPPPARVAIPPTDQARADDRPEMKPLPQPDLGSQLPPPVFDDSPLVSQRLPEERAFVALRAGGQAAHSDLCQSHT